jgi:hypothetical protein
VWVAGFYGKPRPLGRAARTRPFFGSLFGFPAVYAHPREVWGVGLRGQQATLSPLVQVDDPEWAHSLDLRLAARSIALRAATNRGVLLLDRRFVGGDDLGSPRRA